MNGFVVAHMLKSEPGPSPATTPGSKNEAIEVPHRVRWPKFQKPTLSSLAILKFQHYFRSGVNAENLEGLGTASLLFLGTQFILVVLWCVFADYSRICDLILPPTAGRFCIHGASRNCSPFLEKYLELVCRNHFKNNLFLVAMDFGKRWKAMFCEWKKPGIGLATCAHLWPRIAIVQGACAPAFSAYARSRCRGFGFCLFYRPDWKELTF